MEIFEVLSDPVRRRILELLARHEMASGEVVVAIGAEFGITQAAVSQHLKALRENWIAGAALDVYEKEPLPADSPLRDPAIADRCRL